MLDEIESQDQISKPNPYIIPIAIVIAGGLIAGALWLKGDQKYDTSATIGGKPRIVKVDLGNLPVLGETKAKIAIVEFGDYQCPFCSKFFFDVEPILRDRYIKSGQAKMVWRDFAFLGSESFFAAEAARCANDQGKFWQYHDLLFNRQQGENQEAFSKDKLKSFAGELTLNQTDFDACLDSGKYTQAVKDDTDAGRQVGVNGSPATFINGEMIEGVDPSQPFAAFEALINKNLK